MSAIAASSTVSTAISIAAVVVVLSWVALFVILLGSYAAIVLARKARRRSATDPTAGGGAGQGTRANRQPTRGQTAGVPPADLDALRRSDPTFDEQLLLDAAQTAALLMFVAVATGDEAPIARVVTNSYWHTPQGRILQTVARDRRTEDEFARDNPRGSRARQQTIPIDYQASAPELTTVQLGSHEEVHVRVAFGQLAAIIRPGAGALADSAAAASLTSGFVNIGRSVAAQAADGTQQNVSWGGSDGHYDLTFVRPAGAQTDPAAALADRTCTTCGATYRSELATACQHCGTARPVPWGQWQLAAADPAS
jgi:hypothetical protein